MPYDHKKRIRPLMAASRGRLGGSSTGLLPSYRPPRHGSLAGAGSVPASAEAGRPASHPLPRFAAHRCHPLVSQRRQPEGRPGNVGPFQGGDHAGHLLAHDPGPPSRNRQGHGRAVALRSRQAIFELTRTVGSASSWVIPRLACDALGLTADDAPSPKIEQSYSLISVLGHGRFDFSIRQAS